MKIQLNSDKHISVSTKHSVRIEKKLQQKLKHFVKEITRIEVHLSDENSVKGGIDDKRCLLEARVAKIKPISTEHHASTIDQAVSGASEQLVNALRNRLEKIQSNNRQNKTV